MGMEVGPGSEKGRIRRAWHKARGRRITWEEMKDPSGKVTGRQKKIVMNPGPSLKVWARKQIVEKTSEASTAQAWFDARKAGAASERAAKEQRWANRGATIEATGRASKAARKSKKAAGDKKKAEAATKV